jgi:hypothetical protein
MTTTPTFIPSATYPISSTHPRLAAAVKWAGILSNGETECALRAARAGQTWACEAVDHFGGVHTLIETAFLCRTLHRAGIQVVEVSR